MADYINIGFVTKDDIIVKCTRVIARLSGFRTISCKYPLDGGYSGWREDGNISIESALEKCLGNDMAELACEFTMLGKTVGNAVLQIKKRPGLYCFLMGVPSECLDLDNDIDAVENEITAFMLGTAGFEYAFCDSEADFYDYFAGSGSGKSPYSVFISFGGNEPEVQLSPWRIDGFSGR